VERDIDIAFYHSQTWDEVRITIRTSDHTPLSKQAVVDAFSEALLNHDADAYLAPINKQMLDS
jgi:hypothetical protein